MEWMIGAIVAVMPFAIVIIVAIAMRRKSVVSNRSNNRAARNKANDEGVLLI